MRKDLFKRTLIAVLILTACMMFVLCTGCNKILSTHTNIVTVDSTIVNYHWRDTVITIPYYRAEIDGVLVKADTSGKVNLPEVTSKSDRATVKVAIKNNKLTASATCDSLEKLIKVRDTEIQHLKLIDKQEVKVVKEQFIPKFVKILAIIGGVAIFLVIMRLVIFIVKLIK